MTAPVAAFELGLGMATSSGRMVAMDALSSSDRLVNAPRASGVEVAGGVEVPAEPGVYCWWYSDQPVYIGTTEDLYRQLTQLDTRSGRRPVPAFRRFAGSQAQLLGWLQPGADRQERTAAIDAYVSACSVGWITTGSVAEAESVAAEVVQDLLESDVWQARPGEDRWLRRYLDRLEDRGRVYVEVPIGGGGGHTRRIDAVRFGGLAGGVRYYQQADFDADVRQHSCEIIEVKKTLNRAVIGQLIVARDLASTEWPHDPSAELSLLALVTQSDNALEPICRRHGIRIEKVDRLVEDVQPEFSQ